MQDIYLLEVSEPWKGPKYWLVARQLFFDSSLSDYSSYYYDQVTNTWVAHRFKGTKYYDHNEASLALLACQTAKHIREADDPYYVVVSNQTDENGYGDYLIRSYHNDLVDAQLTLSRDKKATGIDYWTGSAWKHDIQ